MLLEELDHFEKSDMPKGRPNTMNNYGVSIIHTCRGLPALQVEYEGYVCTYDVSC